MGKSVYSRLSAAVLRAAGDHPQPVCGSVPSAGTAEVPGSAMQGHQWASTVRVMRALHSPLPPPRPSCSPPRPRSQVRTRNRSSPPGLGLHPGHTASVSSPNLHCLQSGQGRGPQRPAASPSFPAPLSSTPGLLEELLSCTWTPEADLQAVLSPGCTAGKGGGGSGRARSSWKCRPEGPACPAPSSDLPPPPCASAPLEPASQQRGSHVPRRPRSQPPHPPGPAPAPGDL